MNKKKIQMSLKRLTQIILRLSFNAVGFDYLRAGPLRLTLYVFLFQLILIFFSILIFVHTYLPT